MKISLGALQYYWPRQQVFDFYDEMATTPVDTVYLGEAVCSRRHELRLDDWLQIATSLADSGKEAVLSSLTLIESESDLKALRRQIDNGRFRVEANDMGAVRIASEKRLPFVAGPTLNVFNGSSLKFLAELGATRWVMPPEESGATLEVMHKERPTGMETEVFVLGRLPLAYSARCFTARRFNLQKDACEFRCLEFPEGLALSSREGQSFLNLNGTQTQSAKVYNLLLEMPMLHQLDIDFVRISPQVKNSAALIDILHRTATLALAPKAAWEAAQTLLPAESCNGFWYDKPGLDQYAAMPG